MGERSLQLLHGWRKTASRPTAMPDCALIVPTYRRPVEIIRLLRLVATLPDAPGEFLVVDGSPDDAVNCAVQKWVAERELPFDIAYVKSPPGLTRQRNVGIDACAREFIFFLDDDCLPEPGYFGAIHEVFLNDKKFEVGAVRGFLTNGIHQPVSALWRLRFALGIVPRGKPGKYQQCGTSGTWDSVAPFKGTRPVDVLAGGATAYRRDVFVKHRFSQFFYGYAQGEDFEMALRIGKDWKLLICGDAWVDHRHAESGRPAGFPRGKMAARNRFFIWKRHSPRPGALNQIRFWADHLLSCAYHSISFLLRPWRVYPLGFAAGTIAGLFECLVSPPRYDEPPARQECTFHFVKLHPSTAHAEIA
jgi:GT2 family glycosyltransferase